MSAKDIQVHVQGKDYTLYEASQQFHIPWNTVRQRYYNYQIGDNLIHPVHHLKTTIHGKDYPLRELSRRYGLCPATIYSRYYAGKRGRDLILPPRASIRPKAERSLRQSNQHHIYFQGKYRTFHAISNEYGIAVATLQSRFHRGDRGNDLVRPLGAKIRPSKRPLYIDIHGIRSTFRQLSRDHHLSINTIQNRYYKGERGEKLLLPPNKHYR